MPVDGSLPALVSSAQLPVVAAPGTDAGLTELSTGLVESGCRQGWVSITTTQQPPAWPGVLLQPWYSSGPREISGIQLYDLPSVSAVKAQPEHGDTACCKAAEPRSKPCLCLHPHLYRDSREGSCKMVHSQSYSPAHLLHLLVSKSSDTPIHPKLNPT